jgi:hypothetical protein
VEGEAKRVVKNSQHLEQLKSPVNSRPDNKLMWSHKENGDIVDDND